MIHALLIDLDDTLLKNNLDEFLPAYLQRIGAFMNDLVPAERFVPLLLQATRVMAENLDPELTLERVFAGTFYPSLGVSEESLRPRIQAFYETEFPRLRALTRPVPEARPFVQQARAGGLGLTVATNPLFPRTAIEQRLEWAGVPARDHNYDLITSYEVIHFAKPAPAYYAEILALLGRSPAEAAMVGDNVDADLAPARLLGILAYHVADHPAPGYDGGSLGGVLGWVDKGSAEGAPAVTRSPQALCATLRGDAAALVTLTDRLAGDSWLRRQPPSKWSPVETLCHLRDAEIEVNLPRLEAILTRREPFLSAADTDPWVVERGYQDQAPSEALRAFIRARKQFLTRLEALSPSEWSLPARHALLGPTTLAEVVALVAEHERLHLAALRQAARPRDVPSL
jgi:FMN phosphatase YigB (HAD superfamily)